MIRSEPEHIKELGYKWNTSQQIVHYFEREIAKYTGANYAVAVDSCTNGIFLLLKYLNQPQTITIPSQTYISVPNYIKLAGYDVKFEDKEWSGTYQLKPLNIWDGAGRFTKDMFVGGDNFQVLSFQFKKRLPIGRGGMILTNDEKAYSYLQKMRYDGRNLSKTQFDDDIDMMGYHMYMTPEDAARGLLLLNELDTYNEDTHTNQSYKKITDYPIWSE
jgi:dTDP-4-amino-4,6-dideoxygalactose transaminase